MKKVAISILAFTLIFLPSNPAWPQNQDVKILEVTKEDMNGAMARLSELASKIEYIKLETNPDCLIGEVSYYKVLAFDKGYAIYPVLGKSEILLFGSDGSFITKVGRLGKGPGEYGSSYKVAYDRFTNQLLVINRKRVMIYDKNGNYQNMVVVDHADQILSLEVIDAKSWMLTYIRPNTVGSYESGVLWMDKQGKLIKAFDLSDKNMLGSIPAFASQNRIFQFDGGIYYSMYNHTRYYRLDQKNLWTLSFEVKTPMPAITETLVSQIQQKSVEAYNEWLINNGCVGTSILKNGYLWIYFTNRKPNIVLDYKSNKIFRWSTDPSYEAPGIVNDIDWGPPVNPMIFFGEDKTVELLDVTQLFSYQEKGLLNRNTGTMHGSSALTDLLRKTNPDDNPVIRIVTLKN